MRQKSSGFTLVELLVVITIIGILMSLIFPAVQVIIEAANITSCQNNVKNLAIGARIHVAEQGYFPSGGWGGAWAGDPNLGYGPKQCGGWMYSILPYVSEKDAWGLGRKSGQSQASKSDNAKRIVHTLPIMNCPVRRQTKQFPISEMPNNTSNVSAAARLCYAMCAGSGTAKFSDGPDTIEEGLGQGEDEYSWPAPGTSDGVSFLRSRISKIRDGESKTYMIGEKSINPDTYESEGTGFECRTAYSGWCVDNYRTAAATPLLDLAAPATISHQAFGSGHGSGMSFAFCDGATRNVTYAIDGELHKALANRKNKDNKNNKFIEDMFFELNPN